METSSAEGMIIRPASYGDCDRIHVIEQATSHYPWSFDAIAKELAHPCGFNFVVQDDGKTIVGFILSAIVADELSIHSLATFPQFQRRGIGRRLLESVVDRARARGARHAYLEVRSKNTSAIGLYEKLGFGTLSVRKKYYSGDQDDALIMHKQMNTVP
jgi:[ribosomal protein S18]-alanine N-acetyltransferase